MSDKELKVMESRVIEAAKECPTVKAALAKIFPDVFTPKAEWEDVTENGVVREGGYGFPVYIIGDDAIYQIKEHGVHDIRDATRLCNYKIKNGRIWRKRV